MILVLSVMNCVGFISSRSIHSFRFRSLSRTFNFKHYFDPPYQKINLKKNITMNLYPYRKKLGIAS